MVHQVTGCRNELARDNLLHFRQQAGSCDGEHPNGRSRKFRRTHPASGANERRRNQRGGSEGMECKQERSGLASGGLYCGQFRTGGRQVAGAGQVAYPASAAGRVVLVRCGGHSAVVRMMFSHVLVRHALRRSRFMATAVRKLHRYRRCQRVASEQRQPQQHQYGDEFSG